MWEHYRGVFLLLFEQKIKNSFVALSHSLLSKLTQLWRLPLLRNPEMWKRSNKHLHLADAFIQSDLHCIQVTVFTFDQPLLSLGIKPMILALLAPCSTIWATGKLNKAKTIIYSTLQFLTRLFSCFNRLLFVFVHLFIEYGM